MFGIKDTLVKWEQEAKQVTKKMMGEIKKTKVWQKISSNRFRGFLMIIFGCVCLWFAYRDLKNGIDGIKKGKEE